MNETNAEKALDLLIHDLRAPLSVAQGYLRLLLQNRLESDADRQRAITHTMEALGRIGRFCDDAAAYAAEETVAEGVPASVVQVAEFVGKVTEACATLGFGALTFSVEPQALNGVLRSAQMDRIIQSVAVILCAVRKSTRDDSVRVLVHEDRNEARFLLGCDSDRAALTAQPPETFDPWRGGHGIALPLACRVVTAAGGRIWTFANARGAVAIVLPEETSVP